MRRSLALSLALPTLALAACGGESDDAKIKGIINDASVKPASLCDHATDKILARVGGSADACKKLAGKQPKSSKPKSIDVKVDGDKATATFKSQQNGSSNTVGLVKDGGDWKVDAVK